MEPAPAPSPGSAGPFGRLWLHVLHRSVAIPLIAVFGISVLVVSPHGEFPLNDDWIHARIVQNFLESGTYANHPYITSTFVVQGLWGALFAKLFGFSFTVLRVSTLVLAVVGGWAVARAAIVLGLSRGLALLCGVVVSANPLMLSLSYSFMTDVPFLAASSLAALCFLLYLRDGRTSWLALSVVCGVLAFFIRQTGLAMPAAVGATLLVLDVKGRVPRRREAWLAFLLPGIVGAGAYLWFSAGAEKSTPMLLGMRSLLTEAVEGARYLPTLFAYVGLLSLPLIFLVPWKRLASKSTRLGFACFFAGCAGLILVPRLLSLAKLLIRHKTSDWLDQYAVRMPLLENDYIHDLSVSFPHMPGWTPVPPVSIGGAWWILTLAALAVAGFFFLGAVKPLNLREAKEESPGGASRLFLVLWFLIAAATMVNPWRGIAVVDRYLLPALAPFVLLVACDVRTPGSRRAFLAASAAAVISWGFGLVCVQDYLAWNRAAWEAQERLLTVHRVSTYRIRGEDTFQGWHNSEEYMRRFHTRNFWETNRTRLGPWTFDDEYVVTAADSLPGYDEVERITYRTWLGMGDRAIVTFRRRPR